MKIKLDPGAFMPTRAYPTDGGLDIRCPSGSIVVKLFNHGGHDYKIEEGDKISQLVIVPVLTPDLEFVDELEERGRGNNGFGSSGR